MKIKHAYKVTAFDEQALIEEGKIAKVLMSA